MKGKTLLFKDDLFLAHDPGFTHPECPDRLNAIYSALIGLESNVDLSFSVPVSADQSTLGLVHTPSYIQMVAATAGKPFESLDPDTKTSARSYDAACLAAGSVVEGVRLIASGQARNGFALVRPPGHHAEADRAKGFCLFNNVAVGAAYGLKKVGLKKILIIDWDLHHGNGTQHSFYEMDQVLYFSIHQYPFYPGTGAMHEIGRGEGLGYTVNVPFAGGQNDQAYLAVFNDILLPIARQYQPEMILVSAGYDIYYGDPLGSMAVSEAGFSAMTRLLVNLAEELCGGRLMLTLEGGYDLEGLKTGVIATINELVGKNTGGPSSELLESAFGQPGCPGLEALKMIRQVFKDHWTF
ncbi:MAG: histone deacetylase [Proteobacteria bacterium]|nr:histone deacetylase [Pseudomonadota bacterium]MBU1687034.1 histone deacetylase [Pseudomonadota bacterium]